jgi:hypothetical protein
MKKYYDIKFISPSGHMGEHAALEAISSEEAAVMSPIILSSNTPWEPEEFKVLEVVPSKHIAENSNV